MRGLIMDYQLRVPALRKRAAGLLNWKPPAK